MNRWQLSQAARTIHRGGIIAYPTEAVFGLGCDPYNPMAVHRLLEIKHRPENKGLILIASDLSQLQPFIKPLTAEDKTLLAETWPGPHTWLLPAHEDTPRWLRGQHSSIAVRITAHPIAAALCETTGRALVSTSANLTGQRPATTPLQIHNQFPHALDFILNGKLGTEKGPSTIRDLTTKKLIRTPSS